MARKRSTHPRRGGRTKFEPSPHECTQTKHKWEKNQEEEGGRARTLPPKKIRSTSTDTEPLESPMAVASLNPLEAFQKCDAR